MRFVKHYFSTVYMDSTGARGRRVGDRHAFLAGELYFSDKNCNRKSPVDIKLFIGSLVQVGNIFDLRFAVVNVPVDVRPRFGLGFQLEASVLEVLRTEKKAR